ncbi:MAG: Lrp/AsnC family transcriptional regulator [Muribaculaceae bacterium]|nr:Lrp/AsnC family transcriptional regulator [Muribaculaceae bacterium]
MARLQLDNLDMKILGLLADNARKPFLEIARECGVSGAAVHQRMAKLQSMGVVKGYQMLLDPAAVGYETCAYMGFFLKDPSRFDEVVKELEKIPEVVECHFTTGQYDMFIKLFARNNDHLLSVIHDRLQPLGLARTESTISFKQVFNRSVPIYSEN